MTHRLSLPLFSLVLLSIAAGCGSEPASESTAQAAQPVVAAACTGYKVTDLGILPGGRSSSATGIAASGLVSGTSQITASNGPSHAFRWTAAGGQVDLGTLGGTSSLGFGASGARVVGQAQLASGDYHAFLDDGTMHDLGTLGGGGLDASAARGVNDSGVAVGSSRLANGFMHAAMWTNGTATDLGTLLGPSVTANSRAFAINDAGQIAGASDSADGGEHATIWKNGTVVDLGTLGACGAGTGCSVATAIASNGDAAGNAAVSSSVLHPVFFHAGTVVDLGLPAGYQQGTANGVNGNGQVVGRVSFQSGEAPGGQHGFVWQDGTQTDLGTLVGGTWAIDNANAIDDSGRIAATGHQTTGAGHALLLTPECTSGTPAFRSVATSTNSPVVDAPSGVVAGDLLVAGLEVDADPVVVTPPVGWTLVRDQRSGAGTAQAFHALVYSHRATASEPAQYTFGVASEIYVDVSVAAYSNVTSVHASAGASATGTAIGAPSLTATAANEMLVVYYVDFEGGTWTRGAKLTVRSRYDSTSLQDQLVVAPGATGARRATNSRGALAAISVLLH